MDLSRGVGFVVAGAAKGGLWRGRRVCSHEGRPVSFRYGTLDRVNNGLVLRMSVGTEAGGDQIRDVCAIVLAGGVGKRMRADRPKQFLTLCGKTILERSLQIFLDMEEVSQVVLVVDEEYRSQFFALQERDHRLVFADPGKERQDSVFNGLQKAYPSSSLLCIHDAARPLVTEQEVRHVLRDASTHGAAVLGVPCKATVKESEDGEFVLRTIERQRLWEVQTPQVIKLGLLHEGFDLVKQSDLQVTDDVSIIEQLGKPVKLTLGEYTNIKITTPEDLPIAESILESRLSSQTTVSPTKVHTIDTTTATATATTNGTHPRL